MYNGMIQFVVDDRTKLETFAEDIAMGDTLRADQKCHHVTIAYKPEQVDYVDGMKGVFYGYDIREGIHNHIAAMFGKIVLDNGEVINDAHITLKGCIPPVNSNKLTISDVSKYLEISFKGTIRVISFDY